MSDLTMKDLDYEKIIENYSKVEELEKKINEIEKNILPLMDKLGKFLDNIDSKIDKKIKLYIENKENINSIEESQDNLVKEKKDKTDKIEKVEELNQEKESKLDVSKFIKVFSQEFDFINKEQFNEEMENDEIMLKKLIELIKRMFGIKDNKISELKVVETGLTNQLSTEKDEVKRLKVVETNLTNQLSTEKDEVKRLKVVETDLTNQLSTEKDEVKRLKVVETNLTNQLSTEKDEVKRLKVVETNLTNQLSTEKDEVKRLKVVETGLTNQLSTEKDEVKRLKVVEINLTNQLNTKKEELESIGDLLEARKLYDKYLSMETRILSKLDNVLIQRDFESFISSGYTLSSLDNVWDIVKIEYKNISNEDKEILKEVFSFFLNQINKRFKEAKYGLVQVEVGEDFDAVNQVDLSQNSKGKVTECVFYGYGFLKEKENPNDEDIIARIIKSPLVLTA